MRTHLKRMVKPLIVVVVLLAVFVAVAWRVGFFANDTPTAAIAITRTANGDPAVVLQACTGTLNHIEVDLMLGEGKTKTIGLLTTSDPITPGGPHTVDLLHPGDGWTASVPLVTTPGPISVFAWGGKGEGANQADFRFDQLATLRPGKDVMSDLYVPGVPDPESDDDNGTSPVFTLSTFLDNIC